MLCATFSLCELLCYKSRRARVSVPLLHMSLPVAWSLAHGSQICWVNEYFGISGGKDWYPRYVPEVFKICFWFLF